MDLNEKNVKKIKEIIVFTIIFLVACINYQKVFGVFQAGIRIIFPFVLGGAIAFILNVPMRFIEGLWKGKKAGNLKRVMSLTLALLLVIGVVFLVIFVVMPEIGETLRVISEGIPIFWAEATIFLENALAQFPEISEKVQQLAFDWEKVLDGVWTFFKSSASMLNSTMSAAKVVISGLTSFFIGIVFSLYILLQKETLGSQTVHVLRAFVPKYADRIITIGKLTEKIFSNFLTGQCMEAVILGTMFFVTLSIFKLPYALLIGVLIAFTALIPIFGAFIGMGVGVFLMLMVNPLNALWFTIIFLVLQQVEGNLIYPYVVGGSVGLPSIWVLFAVTVGGSLMGVVGMLIFIPLCSVIYTLLRESVHKRLRITEPKEPVRPQRTQKPGNNRKQETTDTRKAPTGPKNVKK